jgi:hypothetical protein
MLVIADNESVIWTIIATSDIGAKLRFGKPAIDTTAARGEGEAVGAVG